VGKVGRKEGGSGIVGVEGDMERDMEGEIEREIEEDMEEGETDKVEGDPVCGRDLKRGWVRWLVWVCRSMRS
jgi:hypothetical protein